MFNSTWITYVYNNSSLYNYSSQRQPPNMPIISTTFWRIHSWSAASSKNLQTSFADCWTCTIYYVKTTNSVLKNLLSGYLEMSTFWNTNIVLFNIEYHNPTDAAPSLISFSPFPLIRFSVCHCVIDIYALREIWTWFFPEVDVVIIRGPLARGIISQPRGKHEYLPWCIQYFIF
jgi:hypothetical protein